MIEPGRTGRFQQVATATKVLEQSHLGVLSSVLEER